MLFTAKKVEVYSIEEFLNRPKVHDTRNLLPMFGFMGLPNITHHTFFSLAGSGAYWVVFIVAGVAFLSTLLEYLYRSRGYDDRADFIDMFTKLMFPIAFYIFLYFGIIKTF